MPKSKYGSTLETTDLARFDRFLLGPCTDILRAILATEMDPPFLSYKVKTFVAQFGQNNKKNPFDKKQESIIYQGNYSKFDITLLYAILRNVCNIQQPSNGWGRNPDPCDRSVSANIERIRILRNDRGHYDNIGISKDEYENICKDIIAILSELENFLSSSPTLLSKAISYVDNPSKCSEAVKEIMKMPMDSEQEHKLKIQKRTSDKNLERVKESRMTWTETVKSEQLREQFNSFTVEINNNKQSCSFVGELFKNDFKQELETEIKSLAQRVLLTNNFERTDSLQPMETAVYEVDVTSNDNKLSVTEKSIKDRFFDLHCARIILITTKRVQVVDAKLAVYKKYKDKIDANHSIPILLHHEYEEIDEVAKLSAWNRLSTYCCFIEFVIIFFGKGLKECLQETNTQDKITKWIQQINEEDVGRLKTERGWKESVFLKIKRIISENEEADCKGVLADIFERTVKDLDSILKQLHKFQTTIGPADQREMIKALVKRELKEDSYVHQHYPSIYRYIVGYRDDKKIVKVYLRQEDKNVEHFFENCCEKSEETTFEYVNINNQTSQNDADDASAPAVDNSTRIRLDQIICEYYEKFSALYTTFTGMRIGKSRRQNNSILHEPCIVLYCLDKTFIPVGEKPIPGSIEGWPCDIRKGYPFLGTCCCNCMSSEQNVPMPGCSISMPYSNNTGSVGFLVEPKNPSDSFRCGFLTAAHVVIDEFSYENLYDRHKELQMTSSQDKKYSVVHPSYLDSQENHVVGEVVESFCGNYISTGTGIDLAVIKCTECTQNGEKETLQVAKREDLTFDENIKVMKKGRTTGTTIGYLEDDSLTIKVNPCFSPNSYFVFHNCYAVRSSPGNEPFFAKGDSGSAVFVIDSDERIKPLGIAFASLPNLVAVCKIDEIIDKLDLNIISYLESPRDLPKDTRKLTEKTQERNVIEKPQEPTEKPQKPTEKTQEPTADAHCPTEDTQDLTKSTEKLII